MAKFVANNNKSAFTKLIFFITLKNLYSYLDFDIINFLNIIICNQINKKKAINILKAI